MDGVLYIGCLAEPERQPQRSVPQPERLEAESEPQLVRERLERDLPVRCRPQLSSFFLALVGGVFFTYLTNPSAKHFTNLI